MEVGFGLGWAARSVCAESRSAHVCVRRSQRRRRRCRTGLVVVCGPTEKKGGPGSSTAGENDVPVPIRRRGRPRKTIEPVAGQESKDATDSEGTETGTTTTVVLTAEDAVIGENGDDGSDAVPPAFEISCPMYVEISLPRRRGVEEHSDASAVGKSSGGGTDKNEDEDEMESLYQLEWRHGLDNWGVFGDGTYVSQSEYGPSEDEAKGKNWLSPGKSIDIDSLGLEIFHPDAVLDLAQKSAIRALCERRSVIYSSPEQGSELAIVRDVALRCRLWGRRMIYSSASRRKNERVRALIAEAIGEDLVSFDIGDVTENTGGKVREEWSTAYVVSAEVLHEMVFNAENCPLGSTDVVIMDDFVLTEQSHRLWEELIVAMPTRILVALLTRRLSPRDMEEIPLWFNHVMNAGCRAVRLTRASHCRAFVFNASYDTSLRSLDISESARPKLDLISEASMRAEEADEQQDPVSAARYEEEAVSAAESLLNGRPGPPVTLRENLVLSGGEPEFDGSTIAQIILRAGNPTPSVRKEQLPLLALVHGRDEAEMTVQAVFSALRGVTLVDADEEEAVRTATSPTRIALQEAGALTDEMSQWFDQIVSGCAALHNGLLPVQNALAEELFRAGVIKVLAVDTHLGAREIANLESARTVVVEASAVTHHERAGKGVLHGSLVRDLVGRKGEHDEGNVVVVWDDEDLQPYELAAEASSALTAEVGLVVAPGVALDAVSILRTLRRFGSEDWQQLWTLSIDELRRSMDCVPLTQELESVQDELDAMKSQLSEVNWVDMAKLTRMEAKVRERSRMLVDMWQHQDSIWVAYVAERVKMAPIGLLVGLRVPAVEADDFALSGGDGEEQTLPLSRYLDDDDVDDIVLRREAVKPAALVKVMEARRPSGSGANTDVAVITADGLFRLVPLRDLQAVAVDIVIQQAQRGPLEVPLEGEFDEDPDCGWPTCESSDPSVSAVAKAVGAEVAKHSRELERQRPSELDNQIRRFRLAEDELARNPWYGRREEVEQLRSERRKMAELEKRVVALQDRIDQLMKDAPRYKSLPKRIDNRLRILEELNCTSNNGQEITGMGMVTLHLSCASQFWIMAGVLLTDVPKLKWFELAATLVAINSDFNQTLGRLYEGGEYREEFVGAPVVSQMLDLRDNIRMIEDKYDVELEQRLLTPLDTRLASLIKCWAQGDLWQDAIRQVDLGGLGSGDVVRVVRRAVSIARQFADVEKQPWIVAALRRQMSLAADGIDRIPVRDFEILREIDALVAKAREDTPDFDAIQRWWEGLESKADAAAAPTPGRKTRRK